jgi:membrane protease YdiL (CAAX protease family)
MDSILGVDAIRSFVVGAKAERAPMAGGWRGLELFRPAPDCDRDDDVDFYHRGFHASLSPLSRPRPAEFTEFLFSAGYRVFFLVAAISGGICEEICYRGLPLRLFARTTVQAWLALPAAMVAFVFIHGRFGASLPLFYLLCGLLDGGIFIFLGRRHLEWLMVAHALYDGWFILAP